MKPKISLLVASAAILATALHPLALYAEDGSTSTDTTQSSDSSSHDITTNPTVKTETETDTQETEQRNAEIEAAHKGKLEGFRLAHCEEHQTKINDLIAKFGEQGTKHLAVFDQVANRVETFVSNHPNFKPDNYDTLVADINAKRAAASAAIDVVKSTTFTCGSDAPLGQLMAFKQTVKDMRTALHDYRTAIKNLIVAVKAKAGTTESTNHTESNQ